VKRHQSRKRPHKLFGSIFKRALSFAPLSWLKRREANYTPPGSLVNRFLLIFSEKRFPFKYNALRPISLPEELCSGVSVEVGAFYSFQTAGQLLFSTIFETMKRQEFASAKSGFSCCF